MERPQSPFDGVFACLDAPPRPPLSRFGPPVTAPRSTGLLIVMSLGRRRSDTVICVAVMFCSSCDAHSCQHADAQASITFNTVASAILWQSHRSCVCVARRFCASEQCHMTLRHDFCAARRLRVENPECTRVMLLYECLCRNMSEYSVVPITVCYKRLI